MRFKCRQLLTVLTVAAIALASEADAQLVGLWEFENSVDLTASTIGADLVLTGTDLAVAGSGGLDTGGAQLDVGDYYTMTHGIGPNGGGAFVNEWTLVLDISYPQSSVGSWMTFYQTSAGNSNDGEAFIRPSSPTGAVGVAATGYSTNVTAADTWYRVVFSVDNGNFHKTYVDGIEWVDGGIQIVDDRFSIDSIMHLFADNDGDDATTNVSNAAIYDKSLSPFEVSSLGVAGDPIASFKNPVLVLEINRDNGSITLNNSNIGAAQDIQGYSIISSAGALIEANYIPLADSDPNWIQFSAAGATDDLSEGNLVTDSIADGASIMLDDGVNGGWLQYFDEEVTFEYLDGNSVLVTGDVIFTGTTQTTPFQEGDLNFDGTLDGLDWGVYVAELGNNFTNLSNAQAYRKGDLNNDGVNNHADFLAFKQAYNSVNGAGSFEAMIAGVPEPTTLVLALAGLAFGSFRLRRHRLNVALTTTVCVFVFGVGQALAVLPSPNAVWNFNNNLNNDIGGGSTAMASGFSPTYTNSTIGGLSATVINLPDFPADEGLLINNNAVANPGGATYINNFTLVIDINVPDVTADFTSILQTSPANANDVDVFARPGSNPAGLDIGAVTSEAILGSNTWQRLAIVNENIGGVNTTSLYSDGVFVDSVNNGGTDGVFALESTFFLFADNDGENNSKLVNSVSYWNATLTPIEILALGGPDANGIDPSVSIPGLTLNVNKTTGKITMENGSGIDLPEPINFYEIISGDGLLSTGSWTSFSDQNLDPVNGGNNPGETWDEGGGSGVGNLTEAFLLGSTMFANTDSINLGNVYTGGIGGAEELRFNFALASGIVVEGDVNYFTSGTDGDFDFDGDVDGKDFLIWQRGDSPNSLSPTDLALWNGNFGNSSAVATTSAVPEPSCLLLFGLGLAGLTLPGRKSYHCW